MYLPWLGVAAGLLTTVEQIPLEVAIPVGFGVLSWIPRIYQACVDYSAVHLACDIPSAPAYGGGAPSLFET